MIKIILLQFWFTEGRLSDIKPWLPACILRPCDQLFKTIFNENKKHFDYLEKNTQIISNRFQRYMLFLNTTEEPGHTTDSGNTWRVNNIVARLKLILPQLRHFDRTNNSDYRMLGLITCTLSWCPQLMLLSQALAPCTRSPQWWTSSFGDGAGWVQPWLTSVIGTEEINIKNPLLLNISALSACRKFQHSFPAPLRSLTCVWCTGSHAPGIRKQQQHDINNNKYWLILNNLSKSYETPKSFQQRITTLIPI